MEVRHNKMTEDEKTKRQKQIGLAVIGILALYAFNLGGFQDWSNTNVISKLVPAQSMMTPGTTCNAPGQEIVTGMFCTAADGSAGKTKTVCNPMTYRWESTCVSQGSSAPVTPTTPITGNPVLVCPEEYASFNVMVEDSLDEEAKPQTLLSQQTVRIVSSAGQELSKANSSSTGATEMKVPCKMDNVQFLTTGDTIYESDEVIVGGNLYKGATVPTYYLKDGRTPIAYNLEPALVKAKKMGNISVIMWNADPTVTTKTQNITLGANDDSKDYIRFKVSENDDDEAGQGIVLLVDYPLTNVKKLELEGVTSGLTLVKDASAAMNNFSNYEQAWRVYLNGKPLVLDRDTRTAEPSDAEGLLRVTTSSSDPTAGAQITIQPVDSMRYLQASGTQVGWASGGAYATQDSDSQDIGLTLGAQINGTLWLE